MNQDEAIKMLRKGSKGVSEWNSWRAANKDRSNLPTFQYARLAMLDLSGVDFGWVDLRATNRSGANLSHADLTVASLAGVNVQRANLSGVNLVHADLTQADLSAACIRGASLFSTNLIKARLDRADVTGATCSHTRFVEVELLNVLGLESLKFTGECSIGIETLVHQKASYLNRSSVAAAFPKK